MEALLVVVAIVGVLAQRKIAALWRALDEQRQRIEQLEGEVARLRQLR